MCPLLKAFEMRGARDQTTKVRRRAFSLLTIMSRAQRQRARTEMWQSNYGTETRGRPRVRRVRGYRCVVVERRLPFRWWLHRVTESGIRRYPHINDLVILYTQAFSFLRAGCGGIRTACAATSQLARTRVSVSVSHRRESVACRDSARGLAAEQFDANSEVATRPRGPRGSFGDARAHTSCVRTQPHKAGHRTRCSFPLDRLGGFDAFTTGSLSK